jgi:Protein of unknown function (DUF3108)
MLKKFTTLVLVVFLPIQIVKAENIPSPSLNAKPFEATYNIIHKHDKVGEGVRKLEVLPNGKVQYSYKTNIEWLIFSDRRSETSIIEVKDGIVMPQHYISKREGTGRDKYYEWTYDIAANKAKDIKKDTEINVDFPGDIQDKLSYHFQHRLNMMANPEQAHYVYPVISTSGSIKNYVYEYDGAEELVLPYGLVKTIRLKREVVDKKRVTYAWFAPEMDYLLVKLYQTKGDVEQFEAQLKSHQYLK